MTTVAELRRLTDSIDSDTTLNDWREIHDTFDEAMSDAERHHRVTVNIFVEANHKYLASR